MFLRNRTHSSSSGCTFGDNLDEKNPGLDTGYVKNDGEKLKLRSGPF